MLQVEIDEEDIITIICKLICQLCQSIWQEGCSPSVRKSTRTPRPRDFYDPTGVNSNWRSPEALEIRNRSKGNQNVSHSFTESDSEKVSQHVSDKGACEEEKEIQERLDELEIDVNIFIDSPTMNTRMDET